MTTFPMKGVTTAFVDPVAANRVVHAVDVMAVEMPSVLPALQNTIF
jgi:hypothetical protein